MPPLDLVVLAILPLTVWGGSVYVTRSTGGFGAALRASWSAKAKQELARGARSWALYVLNTFLVALVAVLFWSRLQGSGLIETILGPSHLGRDIFHGIFLGLTLLGLLLIFKRHFPEARKFSLLVMAGAASPLLTRVSVLLIVVFTEELWRAVCLKSLIADGLSGPQALIVTSIAYGLTYLLWKVPVAISEAIIGAACGGLFLWSNSVIVSFAAHTMIQGQVLLYAIAAAPDAEPGQMSRRPFTECPACGTTLNLRQVNLNPNETFFCPFCDARITISDSRRGFLRWGFVFVSTGILIASWDILPDALGGSAAQYWLSLAITFCTCVGLWSFLQVIFPPKLECGDPDVIALNLGARDGAHPDREKRDPPADRRRNRS